MKRVVSATLLMMCACSQDSTLAPDVPIAGEISVVDYGQEQAANCVISSNQRPPFTRRIGCLSDFEALAARPISAIIPGAWTVKTLVDLHDGDALYFADTKTYPTHRQFASSVIQGVSADDFDKEYSSLSRRFLAGAVTRYERPGVWVYEIEPWDTASAAMVKKGLELAAASVFFGDELYFHPASDEALALVPELLTSVKVITTLEILDAQQYRPMNIGSTVGRLRFIKDMSGGSSFEAGRDVVVLAEMPADMVACAGIISSGVQTLLSSANIRATDRGSPSMGLAGASQDNKLKSLEGKWVRLTVGPFDWSIAEVSEAEADAFWSAKPKAVQVLEPDLDTKDIRDVSEIVFPGDLPAFGGPAVNFGVLARMGQDDVPTPKAFAVPMYYYKQFERQNGFDAEIEAMLSDPAFVKDAAVRDARLLELRSRMMAAELDAGLLASVNARITAEFFGQPVIIRPSSNAEGLAGFSGAGLYDAQVYDPSDPKSDLATAIRKVFASLWNFRAFEEREWYGIDHRNVGMGLLCHRAFLSPDANGTALTRGIFGGEEPYFYIHALNGSASEGASEDEFLYFYEHEGHPTVFISHASPKGTALSGAQAFALGRALNAIHNDGTFKKTYAKGQPGYAMRVTFLYHTEPGEVASRLWITGALPHRVWIW